MRKLNLDEKRRIEKMMFLDIEKGGEEYKSKREAEKEELLEKLNNAIPEAVKKAFADYKKAEKEKKAKEEYIKKLGYSTSGWNDDEKVVVNTYGNLPAEIKEFDRETERTGKKIDALKRKFTLKLYAGDIEEIHNLFGDLTKELEATITVR